MLAPAIRSALLPQRGPRVRVVVGEVVELAAKVLLGQRPQLRAALERRPIAFLVAERAHVRMALGQLLASAVYSARPPGHNARITVAGLALARVRQEVLGVMREADDGRFLRRAPRAQADRGPQSRLASPLDRVDAHIPRDDRAGELGLIHRLLDLVRAEDPPAIHRGPRLLVVADADNEGGHLPVVLLSLRVHAHHRPVLSEINLHPLLHILILGDPAPLGIDPKPTRVALALLVILPDRRELGLVVGRCEELCALARSDVLDPRVAPALLGHLLV
mmetsp:Transcript_40982/g.96380  ORF Transcript_40982/g.96380 Transcript_40982/m.96380 type:complete len:277 (+) Transcript_40982:270-1100(+)